MDKAIVGVDVLGRLTPVGWEIPKELPTPTLRLATASERPEIKIFGQTPSGGKPEEFRAPFDLSITRVVINVPGFKVGGYADYCLQLRRDEPPKYPLGRPEQRVGRGGFIEPLCFNTVRSEAVEGWVYPTEPQDGPVFVPAGDWRQSVDLSDTPIFLEETHECLRNPATRR